MKNLNRRSSSANGDLDNFAIRAEEYSSYITRTKIPPHVALERIANLAEKAMNYVHTMKNSKGVTVKDTRVSRKEGRESQRNKVLDRIWEAYRVVQEAEIMHPQAQGKDESWNSATRNTKTGKWESAPVNYYGDHFEYVVGDELYGNKAQGKTPVRGSNENLTQGDDE